MFCSKLLTLQENLQEMQTSQKEKLNRMSLAELNHPIHHGLSGTGQHKCFCSQPKKARRIETDLHEMIKIKKSLGEIVSMVQRRRKICYSVWFDKIKQIVDLTNRLHELWKCSYLRSCLKMRFMTCRRKRLKSFLNNENISCLKTRFSEL